MMVTYCIKNIVLIKINVKIITNNYEGVILVRLKNDTEPFAL